MKKALIFGGQIVEIAADTFPVSDEMQWIDAPFDATMETHILSGGAVVPKPPKTPAEIAADDSRAALADLAALDLASIRDIRAYIAAQPDAPQTLKDREAAAVLARARVRP